MDPSTLLNLVSSNFSDSSNDENSPSLTHAQFRASQSQKQASKSDEKLATTTTSSSNSKQAIEVSSGDSDDSSSDSSDSSDSDDSKPAAPVLPKTPIKTPVQSSSSTPLNPNQPQSLTAGSAKSSDSKRKSSSRRYWDEADISLKCYNCDGVGHISSQCQLAKKYKPCTICGLRSHQNWKCPRDQCFNCLSEGHQSRDCKNSDRYVLPVVCARCGGLNHTHDICSTSLSSGKWDLSDVHCINCGKAGHISCAGQKLGRGALFCCNCGRRGHLFSECEQVRLDVNLNTEYYSALMENNRSKLSFLNDVECFQCFQTGHRAKECPNRGKGKNRNQRGDNSRGRQSDQSNYSNRSGGGDRNGDRDNEDRDRDRKRGRDRSWDRSRDRGGDDYRKSSKERSRDRDRDYDRHESSHTSSHKKRRS